MPWVQYAQNFEDVTLRRALKHIPQGCFLDVGAFHPIDDSNTYAFYECGWRGIAIDALAELSAPWAQLRPGDTFICAAAGAAAGTRDFFVAPQNGQLSTTRPEQADVYRDTGVSLLTRAVPVVRLETVLDEHLRGRPLHLLSLDVEGGEADALRGLNLARHRPWVMVIEATVPGSPTPSHGAWEDQVLGAEYDFAYFDGLNRFYVAREHGELKRHFGLPPNVWDGFVSHRVVLLERALAAERSRKP